ncbi:hypothetical protein [Streptomyces luteogriseus]|uniref:hypothetical protein n=1 Tax=Streptomyces luteogriseus TaxID=68233 RepID=UPI00382B5DA4
MTRRSSPDCWPTRGSPGRPHATGVALPSSAGCCASGSPGFRSPTTRSHRPGWGTPSAVSRSTAGTATASTPQLLWNELTGCVPDQIRRQSELARASVDFFVALLAGHVAVALTAALALAGGDRPDRLALVSTLVVLTLLVPVWYRSAVTATDEWAAAVRALVNTGRKPLAASLGLGLPQTLAAERDMWTMVSRLSRIPYHERAAALDQYRAEPATDPV